MKYLVRVTETLSRSFIVEAENETDAEIVVNKIYTMDGIDIDYDDFDGAEFECIREATDADATYYEELEVEE